VVASLIVPPPVLFLDGPTTGLDPRGRAGIWSAIRALASRRPSSESKASSRILRHDGMARRDTGG